MNKVIWIIAAVILLPCSLPAQKIYRKTNDEIFELRKTAEQVFEQGEYQKAAEYYSRLIRLDGKVPEYKYRAAAAFAYINVRDSAFRLLNEIAPVFSDLKHIETDASFSSLHSDSRWKKIIDQVKKNSDAIELNYDKKLRLALDTILHDDQDDRKIYKGMLAQHGANSKQIHELDKSIARKDSLNIAKIKTLLSKYGWPDPKIIGDEGEITIFLVIQHATIETQKMLSKQIENAFQKGFIEPGWYASFLDKIAVNDGKDQAYGTQVHFDSLAKGYFIWPLVDPENVDKRRSEMGLNPLSEYLKFYNIDWSIDNYHKTIKSYNPRK